MSTFREGDKVRVVDVVGAERQLRLGDVHTVEKVVYGGPAMGELVVLEYGLKPNRAEGFFAKRFKLVKGDKKVTKFKVGDKVRALDNVQIPKGAIGTVADVAYPELPNTLYGIDGTAARLWGNWHHHFELVKDDVKVGDYVAFDSYTSKTGTVKSIETYATVKSEGGQDYVRKLDELTPAVKPDPIAAEPAHGRAFRFGASSYTWVWEDKGWSFLRHDGTKSGNKESWESLYRRYVGPNSKNSFTVL